MSRLQEQYKNEILPKLKEELGVSNSMSVPKIEKITINMGLGSALGDKKILESALEELGLISSQKPMTCLARKSVASFKLREGNAIGCKVTLRKEKLKRRELSRVKEILSHIPDSLIEGIKVHSQNIFGTRGYSIGHYAKVVRADLLIMNAAENRKGFFGRIFPQDLEHILSELPTDVLVIKSKENG